MSRAAPSSLPAEPSSAVGRALSRWAWTLLNAVQLIFTLSWSAVCITLALLVRLLTRSTRVPLAMARRLWAPGLIHAAMARLEVDRGTLPFDQPYFFVANHASIIDVPSLFCALPTPLRFIVKRELGRVPFLGWYISAMGMIFVDRGARSEALASVRNAAVLARDGRSVASFPEGTRSRDGRIGPFKSGVFLAAIDAQIPVVPVAILGAGAVLPPSGFRVRPGTIRVAVGEPIPTVGLTAADRGRLAQQARSAVVALRSRLES
jgi:1-acyl-sn-glycerol-3-phosphate acyltransferase